MSSGKTFAIIGAGQSGGWTAKTLRDEGFEGRIILFGDEPYPPYERPPLSKEVLLGDQPVESTYLWPAGSYDEWNVEMRLGTRVASISPAGHSLTLENGETVLYDRLMIATGGRARPLRVPGADLDGVHLLRAISDTIAIRKGISQGSRFFVVGGGWIGLEVAAAARKQGAEVTLVETLDQLCGRALTPEFAARLLKIHQGHGVDIRLNTSIDHFEGDGSVARAVLSDGNAVECATAVIGIGLIANTELADAAGLQVDNGIVVDELGRTSDPDIFAAGDVTNHPNALLGRRIRLESWENAQNQAIAAAKSMLDKGAAYTEVPWFWSDQYDVNIQLAGLPVDCDQTVLRGDPDASEFIEFYLRDGRIDGAAAMNNPRDLRFTKRLIQAQKIVDPAQLADPAVKLQAILKS
ncbi:MAG: FAD-dependent oxidoreductase [Pseudomonadota bacterium]|nr:FAD-dependent oxidoreductase [Pseudomonadota bacterium]